MKIDYNFYLADHPDIAQALARLIETTEKDDGLVSLTVHGAALAIEAANHQLFNLQYEVTEDGDVRPRKHSK
jgi:hypothetical protein